MPSNIGNLKKLNHFDVSVNELSGQLPDSIGDLVNLVTFSHIIIHLLVQFHLHLLNGSIEVIQISNNKFIGEIPMEISNKTSLIIFMFQEINCIQMISLHFYQIY